MKNPNVLFMLSDQHNAKILSLEGHPNAKTPCLDKLASEGVYFRNAITQNPICTPSRVSWISGQYCHNHGYYGLSGPNPGGLPTIFGHFRKAGYRTAAFGKIHCPEYWVEDDTDEFSEVYDGLSAAGCKDYDKYLAERNLAQEEDSVELREFPNSLGLQSCDGRASNLRFEDTAEGYCARRGIDFIKSCKEQDAPFFLHISLPRPHQCYTPSEPFWSMYDEKDLVLPPNAEYDMEAAKKAPNLVSASKFWKTGSWTRFEPGTYAAGRLRKLHGYLGCVSQVDFAVGQLVGLIESLGLGDDTIVIYGSDHGDYACEHGIMEKAPGICSDAITRVPMIWKWGDKFARRKAKEIVESVDMVSTVCSLCGLPELETGDGQDLSPLLYGESGEIKRCGVTEFARSKSLRKGDYRYVCYARDYFPEEFPGGFGELYNIKDDPWEMKNLYFEQDCADIVADMKEELIQFLLRTARPVTVHGIEAAKTSQAKFRFSHYINADNKINLNKAKIYTTNYL